ncbi:substrate-binding domain-containing protein [Enterococcus saccharolyticus]|uniref:GntR family transcriptional regulator n=1 Tax=Candidatus Enterococcus willemsii TaxID=1857215 RepID=A0ABQ6YWN7_9ENTE|nr:MULTISPECIES: LacI family DNA-binding transcriptional regulator [Enterococcus]KAF1302107.1 GntR family transcriptional regulator [Enterococcus sp. CU12B]MCD5001914.1 substrate-binding domain-containing protein [Enterococcus saccharolyticus]
MNEPLYKQILRQLKQEILSGQRAINSQLPTEKELSEAYQVSRITSKRALTELEQAGLIYRVRGKGSFVKEQFEPTVHSPSNKVTRILFLLPFLHDLSLGNFTDGLLPVMQAHQVEVIMGTLDVFEQKKSNELMTEYDGLIYYSDYSEQYLDTLVNLALADFPVISLDKKNFELDFPTIVSDNLAGGQLATQHLIDEGHQRIGYLFNHATHHPQSVKNRYIGYLQALNQADLAFHTSAIDSLATQSHVIQYVKNNQLTALVCENDIVAIEAMRTLKQAGYDLPKDLSIIGFDDIQAAQFIEPPLTTIAQDFKQIGELAGKTLLTWIEQQEVPTDIKVPVTFIQRQSTKQI